MFAIRFLFAFLVIIFLTPHPLHAEEIILYVDSANPPKCWSANGHATGILPDIMREVSQRTGLSFKLRIRPWARAYQNALNGEGGIIGLSKTTERQLLFDYSDVMYVDEPRIIVMKGKEFPFNTMRDLKHKTIGVQRDASFGDEYDNALRFLFTPSFDSSPIIRLRKLLAGRVDAVIMDSGMAGVRHTVTLEPDLAEQRYSFVALSKPLVRDPNYIGFAKGMHMEAVIRRIDTALHDMRKDGTIKAIAESY